MAASSLPSPIPSASPSSNPASIGSPPPHRTHQTPHPLHAARTSPHSSASRAFYKPSDDKCFLAKVYDNGQQLPQAGDRGALPADVPVLVSDIVQWELEFRCFILDGKVATLSPYLRNGQRVDTAEGEFVASDDEFADAEQFASKVARDARDTLPTGVDVDIGIIRGRGWAVIEANSACCSVIYGCGASAILPILRRVCLPTATISPEDQRWLTPR